jgi:PAS domain S-box-containing protein
MTDHKHLPPDFTDLRRRAEAQLETEAMPPEKLSPDQAARLIHELRVHQIELEMQNDELRLSQARLEESRSKYADLYDFAPVGYMTLDVTGRIVEANLTAATLLGLERSKLLNRFLPHFLVEADRRVFRQLINNGLDLKERRGEFHLNDAVGNIRVMLLDILFLIDAEGQERRRVTLTDITELKHTQEELRLHKEDLEELVAHRTSQVIEVNEELRQANDQLRQANDQLRQANDQLEALFKAAPLAIGVFDAEGKIVDVNLASELIYGWSREEVQGRLPRSIPEEFPEESLAVLQRVLEGKTFTGIEIKQQRQDGTLIDVSFSAAPLFDAQGKQRGFVSLAQDITERKKLENDVRTQAQVLASMAEGVTVTDQRGQIIYTNPAFDAMFGYKPGELVGRHSNILNFSPPEENLDIVREILDQVNTTGFWTGEFHNCRKEGKPFFTLARLSTIEVGGKKLFISVQEDITQRKRAKEMLERQAELLDLAHDAILVRDPKGRIIYWNQGASQQYGWSREAAMSQVSYKLLKTVFPQPLMEIERQLMDEGFWEGELTHTTRLGKEVVMNSRWNAKRDDEGRIVAILEINQDVTAQKQIEAEVHRLASYPLLNPNAVVEVDQDGKVTYANPAARHLAEKLRFSGGIKAFLPPDLKEKFAAVGKGGPRQYSYDLSLDDRVFTGTLSFPHDLPTARIYAMDITARQHAEEARRESEERYRTLVNLSPDGIMVHAKGRYVFANPAGLKLFGAASPEEIIGRRVLELVHPDSQATVRRRLKAGERLDIREVKILRLDGQTVEVEVAATPITYGGKPAIQVVLRDITERKRAEEALAQKQAEFEAIFNSITDGSVFADAERRIVLVNPAAEALFGYTAEEMRGRNTKFLYASPKDYEKQGRLRYNLEADKPQEVYEITYRRKDGSVFPAEALGGQVKDTHGRSLGFISINRDITERKQAEAAIIQAKEEWERTFDAVPDLISILDKDHRIVRVNKAMAELMANPCEEVVGHTCYKTVHGMDEVPDFCPYAKVLATKQPATAVVEELGLILDVAVSPLFGPDGQLQGGVHIARDVTERQRAAEALQESEERYRSLFENSHAVMLLIEPETGDIVDANPAASAYYGYSRKEFLHYRITDINTLAPEQVREEMQQARTKNRRHFEFKHRLADGVVRDVEVFSGPIRVKGRELLYSIIHDITARKEAEEALVRSNQRLDLLAETAGRLLAADSPQQVVDALCHKVMDFLDCDLFFNFLVDTSEDRLHLNAYAGIPAEEAHNIEWLDYGVAVCGCVAKEGRRIVCEDIQSGDDPRADLIKSYSLKAFACHPLIVGTRVLGTLAFGTREKISFSADDLALMNAVADQVAIAMDREQIEQALREGREDLKRAQAVAHIGSWRLDLRKNELTWSDETHRMFGVPKGTPLTYETFLGTVHPEDREYVDQNWHDTLEGEPYDIEHRIMVDDTVKWVRGLAELDFDHEGELQGGFGTVQDITARKEAEEALKQSEARYRAVGELIPFGSWTATPDGGWVYVSQLFLEMTGKTLEDCQGFGWQNLLPQEDVRSTLRAWQECLGSGCFWDHEFKVRSAAGPYRTILSRGAPLYDSQGRITSWVGINLDISERKDMEEALRRARDGLEQRVEERTTALRLVNEQLFLEIQERQEVEDRLRDSEARFTAFMEHLPGLAVMRDMEGRYLFANRSWEETMDLSPQAWRGRTLDELWTPERAAALQKSDFQIISSGVPTEEVEMQILSDGPHFFLSNRFPILGEDGLPYMVGAIAIDVTARQRAEQQVAETGRLYRILSQVNEAIMRGRDQQSLFDQVCHIVVEEGLFQMAWVGLVDPESQTLGVAAKYGFDKGYLDDLAISLKDGPKSKGPTGTAIRENHYDICNDIAQDRRMEPWRQQALERGYRSSGAFPLRIGARVVGAITLYAPRPEFFTDKEIALLTSLADNLSFALEFLDREAKRRQAEEALATERQQFLDLLENLPAFVYLQAPDYTLRFANREFRDRFGEPDGKACYSLIWGHDEPCPECPTFTVFHTGQPKEWEWTAPDSRIYQVYDYPFADVDGSPLVLEMGIDITERKRAEEALAGERQRFLDLLENLPAYIYLQAQDYSVPFANREFRERFGQPNGKTCYTLKWGKDQHCSECPTLSIFEDGNPKELEWTAADGRIYHVYNYPFLDVDGSPLVLQMGMDITERKRAEEALAEQAMLIQDLYNHAPCGYHSLDSDGYIVQINDTELTWLGYTRDEVVGKQNFANLLTPDSRKVFFDNFSAFKERGWTKDREYELVRKDGTVFSVNLSATAIFDGDGNYLLSRSTIFDITDRKRAETKIIEQGRQLEAFFAHSLTPLVFLDCDFNFLRVNEAYARSCQHEPQDFIGRNHFEFYPHAENQAIFAEVVRSKTPYQVQAKPFEYPDHPEWGVTYWDWSLVPILDQAGEIDFLVYSLRDVTRRVLSEQARNRLIEILEATPDFVAIADFYGYLQYLNRAGRAMVGVGENEDVTRLKVLDLHPKEIGRRILEKAVPKAMKKGSWQAELAFLHRDGHEIPVSQVIQAHKDPKGRVQFFSTVARDISDMKEAQASILRQAAILDGINRIFRETLSCETAADLGQTCLSIAEGLTNSQFGFITEMNQQHRLDALALTEPEWQSCGLKPARDLSNLTSFEPTGLLAQPLKEGKAVINNDPASFPEGTGAPKNYLPLTAYLGIPLVYGGNILGLLGLSNKKGGYTATDQETVESLAPAIVEALMHHRAEDALKISESKLRYLADQLLTAQENERKRLAAELHDELGHALLALKLHLSTIEKKLPPEQEDIKDEIRGQMDYIHEVIQEVRRLYHDLSPGDVEDLGLTKALGTLINDFAAYFPRINWQVDLINMEGLFSLPVQTTIYRIVQEALTNIGKHANPNMVTISSTKENHQVRFVVQDDGAGFDAARVLGSRSSSRGVGLVAMEERLNMVGGTFEIESQVHEGTRLSFTIPAIPEGERP